MEQEESAATPVFKQEEGSQSGDDGEADVEKGSLDDGDGVAIIMNYGQNGSRTVRSFATELPPELEDKGITQKDFGKVVQHVNGIWDSFGERFEGIYPRQTWPFG